MFDLNKIFNFYYGWWKNIDKFILFLILLLFSLGLFFSLVSTSIIASDKLNTNTYYFFIKHLLFIILGIFILITFSAVNQKKLFQRPRARIHSVLLDSVYCKATILKLQHSNQIHLPIQMEM